MGRVFAEGADALAKINRLATVLTGTVERIDAGGTVEQITRLAAALGGAVDRLDRAGALDDLGAAVRSARRITEQVEKGQGWLHALVYEEPEALRRVNAILTSTQALLAKADSRDSAVGVLLSPDSGKAARSLLAAMEALGRGADKPGAGEGLLTTLLFDPEYKPVAQDIQVVAKNLRDVSEKLAHGQGLLGSLLTRRRRWRPRAGRRRLQGGHGQSPGRHRASQGLVRGRSAPCSKTRRCTRTWCRSSTARSGAICCAR